MGIRYLFIMLLLLCICNPVWAAKDYSKLISEGKELLTKGEYNAAEAKFKEAIEKNRRDPEAYMLLGTALNRKGKCSQALKALNRASQLKTKSNAIFFEMGLSYMGLSKYKEAYGSFCQDISNNPPWIATSYLLAGGCLYQLEEYSKAIEYLKDAISKETKQLSQAHYYIGLCQIKLKEYSKAERSFRRVARLSKGTRRGEDASKRVSLLRRVIKAEKKKRPWYASVRLGLFHDTNVISAGKDVVLPTGISKKTDLRSRLSLSAGYRPYQGPKSELWIDYKGNTSFHEQLPDYNTQMSGLALRGIYTLNERLRVGMKAGYDHTWVGGHSYSGIFELSPSVSYRQREWAAVTLAYACQRSDYLIRVAPALDRDGYTNSISLTEDVVVPKTKLSLRGGLKQSWTESDGSDYDFRSFRTSLTLRHPFFFASRISSGVNYTHNDYDNLNSRSVTPKTRDDEQFRLSLGLTKEFTANTTGSISYDWIDNNSNIGLFDYTRGILSLGVTYEF